LSETTAIQWTNRTWNPWRGCTKVHPRCKNCYMFTEQARYGQDPSVVIRTKTWNDPIRWQKKAAGAGVSEMVFTCSWSDWFHVDADQWRPEAWDIVKRCPNLTFQILTKRPQRIAGCLPNDWDGGYPNVWLGSSLDPDDNHGMELFKIPARVKFLSLEPLLGPVDLSKVLSAANWIICGGESGPGARPCRVEWIRSIINQCQAAGLPCFTKQMGSNLVGDEFDKWVCHMKHKKGGEPSEWPADLRIREFPKL